MIGGCIWPTTLPGRLGQVQVTDRRGGEHLGRYQWQAGDVIVADRAMGIAECGAHPPAGRWCCASTQRPSPGNGHGAAVHGSALAPATGRDGTGLARLVSLARPALSGPAHCRPARSGHRAAGAAPQAPQSAKAGRTLTGPTLAVAGWLLVITTLSAATWSPTDVLSLYRARWQVGLVFKKMKQLLCLNQIRSKHRTSVEATVRALLIAWALHEDTTTLLRTLLSAHTTRDVCGEQLAAQRARARHAAQQVQGSWSAARPRRALPRLRRFSAAARGGDIKNALCGHGWHNERAHASTVSNK